VHNEHRQGLCARIARGRSFLMVYGHFRPNTLQSQDISALCVWCRSVSHFYVGAKVMYTHFIFATLMEWNCLENDWQNL